MKNWFQKTFASKEYYNKMMMKALMAASIADGELNDNEKTILFEMYREKFHADESVVKEIVNDVLQSGKIEFEIQKEQVPELINDIAAIIVADNKITEEEENFILNVAKFYNFSEETTIKIIQQYLKKKKS